MYEVIIIGIGILVTLSATVVALNWLVKDGYVGGKRMTHNELRAYVKANYSKQHPKMKLLFFAEVIIACCLMVGVLATLINTSIASSWLHSVLQPESIFFLPFPGLYIAMAASVLPLFISSIAVAYCLNLLLPKAALKPYHAMSNNTPIGDVLSLAKLALIAWAIVAPIIILSIHDYRAVSNNEIISNSFFSLVDRKTQLSDVRSLTVRCNAYWYKGAVQVSPTMVLDTANGQIILWGDADDKLPSKFITAGVIKNYYDALNGRNIRVDVRRSVACDLAARALDKEGRQQYRAMFP